jgi:hypothetical protein
MIFGLILVGFFLFIITPTKYSFLRVNFFLFFILGCISLITNTIIAIVNSDFFQLKYVQFYHGKIKVIVDWILIIIFIIAIIFVDWISLLEDVINPIKDFYDFFD